jgi:hypothetical protein
MLLIGNFIDVPHVQKFVMERIYFAIPKAIPNINPNLDWVINERQSMIEAIDKASIPLYTYLGLFNKFEDFINLDIDAYIESKIKITYKDKDNQELEIPVIVSLDQTSALTDYHNSQIASIESNFPTTPIECGLFMIEIISVRNLLLGKIICTGTKRFLSSLVASLH